MDMYRLAVDWLMVSTLVVEWIEIAIRSGIRNRLHPRGGVD